MAPFEIAIIPINYQKSEAVCKEADSLYEQLTAEGYEVILDDRKERPGVMFADMELIGVPHIIIIGEKALAEGMVEYENRATLEKTKLPLADALAQIKKMLSE
jgi:prolyl-tRNA synthetase